MLKICFTCLILLTPFFLSGCWSSRELTDLAIATALGIDIEDEKFKVTAQVLNPDEIAGKNTTSRTAVSIYTATGNTMFETIRKLTTVSPRKLYLGHIRVIIFGEEFATEGIAGSLDFISRDHEMRTDFLFAVAKNNTAENVLKILTPMERIPANKIYSSLEASQSAWAPTKVVKLDELVASVTSSGKEAVLTGLQVLGDPEKGTQLSNVESVQTPTTIKTDSLAVFKEDQLIGWLNQSESKGLNYITDNIKNTVAWVDCEKEGKITVEIMDSKTKTEGKVEGDTPKVNAKTTIEANIVDVECVIDIMKEENIKKIEEKIENKTEKIMKESVSKAQEIESDIFGFGEIISKQHPEKWKSMEKNWKETFAEKLEFNVRVKVNIRRTGTITQSFLKMIKNKNEGGS